MRPGITVVIPTIPYRDNMLVRALRSVAMQERKPDEIIVSYDNERVGAALTRDRALSQVTTQFVAFLDDDDEFRPNHLMVLEGEALKQRADLVFPWFDVVGGEDPFPMFEGMAWKNDEPRAMPVTFLARTEALRSVGGFSYEGTSNEDYRLAVRMSQANFNIVHISERTWIWHHHANNTSGSPDRW